MVEFETIKAEEIKFGNNNFIELARKKAITDEGENEFISLSRGFFAPTGERRYRKSFTIPLDNAVINFIASKVKDFGPSAIPSASKPKKRALDEDEDMENVENVEDQE